MMTMLETMILSNLVIYFLAVIFFFEAFAPDKDENTASFVITALIWPYIAVKLIVLRIVYGKQEEDDE